MNTKPLLQMAGGGAVAVALLGLGAIGGQLAHELEASEPVGTVSTPPALVIDIGARCAEDDPCWTWSTMGNRTRGVLVADARRVVGPCTYRKLVISGAVDRRAEPMRGDAWAIKYGCGDGATVSVHPTGAVEG